MHKHGALGTQLHLQLASGFEERQPFDVAHSTANFDNRDIGITRASNHPALDFISNVGNNLYGAPQIITATFLAQHSLVYTTGGEVVALIHFGTHKTLVVPQIQVCLSAVLGHKHLTVLEGAHGAWVDVDIGVELEQGHLQATRFEDGPQGGRGDALAKRRNNAASDEYKTRHVMPIYRADEGAGRQNVEFHGPCKMGAQFTSMTGARQ